MFSKENKQRNLKNQPTFSNLRKNNSLFLNVVLYSKQLLLHGFRKEEKLASEIFLCSSFPTFRAYSRTLLQIQFDVINYFCLVDNSRENISTGFQNGVTFSIIFAYRKFKR